MFACICGKYQKKKVCDCSECYVRLLKKEIKHSVFPPKLFVLYPKKTFFGRKEKGVETISYLMKKIERVKRLKKILL